MFRKTVKQCTNPECESQGKGVDDRHEVCPKCSKPLMDTDVLNKKLVVGLGVLAILFVSAGVLLIGILSTRGSKERPEMVTQAPPPPLQNKLASLIEGSTKYEIILRWASKFDESIWKKRAFKEYTLDDGIAKIAVLNAAERVAEDYGLHIPEITGMSLQQRVDCTKGPEAVFSSMEEAMTVSEERPAGDRFAKALKEQLEAAWPDKVAQVWYWRAIPFGQYDATANNELVRRLVLTAIDQVMNDTEMKLPGSVRNQLSGLINLDTRPQAAIEHMKAAAKKAVPA
jgi:hypothetical protein